MTALEAGPEVVAISDDGRTFFEVICRHCGVLDMLDGHQVAVQVAVEHDCPPLDVTIVPKRRAVSPPRRPGNVRIYHQTAVERAGLAGCYFIEFYDVGFRAQLARRVYRAQRAAGHGPQSARLRIIQLILTPATDHVSPR